MLFRLMGKPVNVYPVLYINDSSIEYVKELQHLDNITLYKLVNLTTWPAL